MRLARLVLVGLLILGSFHAYAYAHQATEGSWDEHPGLGMAVEAAFLNSDGTVTAIGWAECPAGEDWGVAFRIFEGSGSVETEPVIPFTCDGTIHAWEGTSNSVDGAGVTMTGVHEWHGKIQNPSVGIPWVHKQLGYRGTVDVQSSSDEPSPAPSPSPSPSPSPTCRMTPDGGIECIETEG